MTCQEVLFFDGGPAWRAGLPAWVDYDAAMYGTADVDGIGFKASLDLEGAADDRPRTNCRRAATPRPRCAATSSGRFPALAKVPLNYARCCRYELTPDTRFIASAHPDTSGSG